MSHQHMDRDCPYCGMSAGAKQLLGLIMEYVYADAPVPSQQRLAELMGVQRRTIERWVRVLRESGLVMTHPRQIGIDLPIGFDREIQNLPTQNDREIQNLPIGFDREINLPTHLSREQDRTRKLQTNLPIESDREMAHGGGDHVSRHGFITNNATRSLRTDVRVSTDTGRYLITEGFSVTKALQFEHLPLDEVRSDFRRRREMGQKHGAIVRAWENVPPAAPALTASSNGYYNPDTVAQIRAELGYDESEHPNV